MSHSVLLKFTEKELEEWKQCEEGDYFKLKFKHPFIIHHCPNGDKKRKREIELKMRIFPKVWIKHDYKDEPDQSTLIVVMLCEESQVKILRSVKLEYKLKVKSVRMKVHGIMKMKQNKDTGFTEQEIPFILTKEIGALWKGLEVEIKVEKIKYFANPKKRKRAEIKEYVISPLKQQNGLKL